MRELSYIHAEGYPAVEMKHGPIALVEKGMPIVFLAPMDHLHEKVLSNIEEVKARGGRAITDSPAAFKDWADDVIIAPSTHPAFAPFVSVVPLQLLAYHVAVVMWTSRGIWRRASRWSDSMNALSQEEPARGARRARRASVIGILMAYVGGRCHARLPLRDRYLSAESLVHLKTLCYTSNPTRSRKQF
jgi:hypothetical protein